MRRWAAPFALALLMLVALQRPAVRAVDERALREYAGVYRWGPDSFVYLQTWTEIIPSIQLVAFDDSGGCAPCCQPIVIGSLPVRV